MLSCPTNAKFLLGVGSPHLAPSRSAATSDTSKSFLRDAAAVLANPSCTDHALWINQIVLRGCRQRVARDSSFLADFSSCIRRNANAIPTAECMTKIDNLVAMLMMMAASASRNEDAAEDDQLTTNGDPWMMVIKILETIELAANESVESQQLRDCEDRRKIFKQSNREDLDKVFGLNNNNNNNHNNAKKNNNNNNAGSPTSNSSSPKVITTGNNSNKTSVFSTPTISNNNKSITKFPVPTTPTSGAAAVSPSQDGASATTFVVDVHSKINETNLQVIRATMTSLREEADYLKQLAQCSPIRTLHRELETILEEAKTRHGLHLVEKWQSQRDKERGRTGNDYGSLVEDYAWRHSIPFLLMSVCNDDPAAKLPASFSRLASNNNNNNNTTGKKGKKSSTSSDDEPSNANGNNVAAMSSPNQNLQLALGERWRGWTLAQRLCWFERCQTMNLSDEEISKADRCYCPRCIASGRISPLSNEEAAKDTAVTCDKLTSSAAQQHPVTEHVESIRRPDRDETKPREKFKLFRRYCWRMKLPFLRLVQNVAYSCQKTKDRNAIKGELDGILVNVCHSSNDGLAVIAVIEVKMNPADLVYARAQREKFVETMRQFGDTMTFSCKSVEDFGRHMTLSRERFDVFLSDPQRRWVFCTVRNKPDKLSVPFYSKISHVFVRAMAGVVSKRDEIMNQLPVFNFSSSSASTSSPTIQMEDNDNPDETEVSETSGDRRQRQLVPSTASAVASANKTKTVSISKEEETAAFQQLKAWSEMIRLLYADWTPSDEECAKVSSSLLGVWQRIVVETGLHPDTKLPLLQSPDSLLAEDDRVKEKNHQLLFMSNNNGNDNKKKSATVEYEVPGNICWIDLPVGATPEQLRRDKTA